MCKNVGEKSNFSVVSNIKNILTIKCYISYVNG